MRVPAIRCREHWLSSGSEELRYLYTGCRQSLFLYNIMRKLCQPDEPDFVSERDFENVIIVTYIYLLFWVSEELIFLFFSIYSLF